MPIATLVNYKNAVPEPRRYPYLAVHREIAGYIVLVTQLNMGVLLSGPIPDRFGAIIDLEEEAKFKPFYGSVILSNA